MFLLPLSSQAQWLTQSIDLKPGWNAIFLHVDASHDTLANLVAADATNPIIEVWLWTPAPVTMQYVQGPQLPTDTGSQWASWNRSSMESSRLQRLTGNAAYLVRVATNVAAYTWNVKGKPVAPAYQWTTTGLNFLGFPTAPAAPPTFEAFLAESPELQQHAEIYQYLGGDFGESNPARVFAFRTTPVKRGQAFWIRSGTAYNRYFGPFEITLAGGSGLDFGDQLSTCNFRLRNLTANPLTVMLRLTASEAPPAGQTAIASVPPLLVRGSLNLTNLTYSYTNLPVASPYTWTLAGKDQPGSEVEVVLGLNRADATGNVGDLLAGILRFTDSVGHSQMDVPVSATIGSRAGLWVGGAAVTQVGQYLKSYHRDAMNNLVSDSSGRYMVTEINTNLGAVARSFPLRLIVHNPATGGNAVLLQRVFCGFDAQTNYIVANAESALNRSLLDQARRISAAHLPWTAANTPWPFNSRLGEAAQLATTVALDFNDHAANPFVHTYHPDHDNLDARFNNLLPQGSESYGIRREIALHPKPPANDFNGLTASGRTITGDYVETITMLGLARAGGTNDTRRFEVRGVFTLNRISEVSTLTTAP